MNGTAARPVIAKPPAVALGGGSDARAAARRGLDRLWRRGARIPRLRPRHHGRRHDLGVGAQPGRRDLERRRLRRDRLRLDDAGAARCRDRRDAARSPAKPFGVNLITLHPQLNELIDVCARRRVGHVVLAGGLPSAAAVQRIKAGGAKLICFAPALAIAKQAGAHGRRRHRHRGHGGRRPYRSGLDRRAGAGDPAPCARGAGLRRRRHRPRRGDRRPISRWAPPGVQLGTRFVCAHESIAHPRFKQAFIRAGARDAVPSVQLDPRFPVIPVRALANDGTENFVEHAASRARPLQSRRGLAEGRPSSRSSTSGPARCAAPSSTAMSRPAR